MIAALLGRSSGNKSRMDEKPLPLFPLLLYRRKMTIVNHFQLERGIPLEFPVRCRSDAVGWSRKANRRTTGRLAPHCQAEYFGRSAKCVRSI